METTKAEAYTIDAIDWEEWEDGADAQEWQYFDENDAFRVMLRLDKRHCTVKLLGESLTYSGDSVYYYDVMEGYPRACAGEWYLIDPAPFALDDDGEQAERLADVFRADEDGHIHIVGAIALPDGFVDTMRYHVDQDDGYDSLAYGFVEYANAHGLKVDDFESFEGNVHAYVAHNTVGGMSYGFANVNPETLDGVMHFIDECYSYDLRGYRAA